MSKFTLLCIMNILFISCASNILKNNHIQIKKGNLPIIINVSHDGNKHLHPKHIRKDSTSNFNNKNDVNTKLIAGLLFDEIKNQFKKEPSILINNIHRKYIDLNRKPNHAYESSGTKRLYNQYYSSLEREIKRLLKNNDRIYLLDIHGFRNDSIDIVFSTRNNTTINSKDEELLVKFSDILEYNGYETKLDGLFYGGYLIKNTSNKFSVNKISAIQIELESKIRRNREKRREVSKIIASELKKYLDNN